MTNLDSKQIELVATAWLEAQLIKNGFEVARPLRDRGIDLIAYSDVVDQPFHAIPIQVKASSESSFSIDRKYAGRGIIMAYIWHVVDAPRLFLLPYEKAVQLLTTNNQQSSSWQDKGRWACTSPTKFQYDGLQKYENDFQTLKNIVH